MSSSHTIKMNIHLEKRTTVNKINFQLTKREAMPGFMFKHKAKKPLIFSFLMK